MSCRNGEASWRSPVCTGASRPRSHRRRPTAYSPDGAAASAPQATSSPTSRCAVGTGSPARSASSVRVSRRCVSSKAPSSASARAVTLAPGEEELPATAPVFHWAEVPGRRARPGHLASPGDRHHRPPPTPTPPRPPRPRSAPRSRRSRAAYAASGVDRDPDRGSTTPLPLQRAAPPDQGPAPRRPRGHRAVVAGLRPPRRRPARGGPHHRSTAASPWGSGRSSPAGCWTARAGRCATSSSRSGRPTPAGATSTSATSTPPPSTRTSPGSGRCLTDADGTYRFTTIKPGPYPWKNHRNAWRPAHIHFSLFGTEFTQRMITQMYFPGDPLFALDPIYQAITDPAARERLVASYDHDVTTHEWATGYRWDIVLTGTHRTPTERGGRPVSREPGDLAPTPGPDDRAVLRLRAARTTATPSSCRPVAPDAIRLHGTRVRRGRRPGARRAARAVAGRTGRRGAPRAGLAAPRRLHVHRLGPRAPPTAPATTRSPRCAPGAAADGGRAVLRGHGVRPRAAGPAVHPRLPARRRRPRWPPTRCSRRWTRSAAARWWRRPTSTATSSTSASRATARPSSCAYR